VLQRAASCGVRCLVAYTSDFEKNEALLKACRENLGVVYCMVRGRSEGVRE
jgi:hypothetical protein